MNRKEFLQKLYSTQQTEELLSAYKNGNLSDEMCAELLFSLGDYAQSALIYKNLGDVYREGYSYLHIGDIEKAKQIWDDFENNSSALTWGKILIAVLNNNWDTYPSYLQIRNYFEIDFGLFLKNKKYNFIHKLVDSLPFFVQINPEVYKFIGASFLNNGYPINSVNFLKQWKNMQYDDPEVHYLLARNYFALNLNENAIKSAQNCLKVAPLYFPARKILQILTENEVQ